MKNTNNVFKISIDYDMSPDELMAMTATIEVRGDEVLKARFTGSTVNGSSPSENKVNVFELITLCKRFADEYRSIYAGKLLLQESSQSGSDISNNA